MNTHFVISLNNVKQAHSGQISPPFYDIKNEPGTRSILILHRANMDGKGVISQQMFQIG